MFFKKKITITFPEFLEKIDSGNLDILELLGLKERDFTTVTHAQLIENPGDIASGVTSVKTKFNLKVFGVFDTLFIKQHDNGDVKFVFFTTTTDVDKIIDMRDSIVKRFELGIYQPELHQSIHDTEKIHELAKARFATEDQDVVTVWTRDKFTLLLQYRTNPLHQFSLFLTVKEEKVIDRSPRRKGTIKSLLTNDLGKLLNSKEDKKEIGLKEGSIGFVDYHYRLQKPELKIFNSIVIRQFVSEKDSEFKSGTSLTFVAHPNANASDKVMAVEKLVELYGMDNSGYDRVEPHEWDMLEEERPWTGRMWNFNEVHGLQDLKNDSERFSYGVWIDSYSSDFGFTLSILAYDRMLEFFESQ